MTANSMSSDAANPSGSYEKAEASQHENAEQLRSQTNPQGSRSHVGDVELSDGQSGSLDGGKSRDE